MKSIAQIVLGLYFVGLLVLAVVVSSCGKDDKNPVVDPERLVKAVYLNAEFEGQTKGEASASSEKALHEAIMRGAE